MDGSVIIEAVLDTTKVAKGVKDVNSTLNGVSWKGIKEGDEAAKKLSGSLKSAGTAATVGLTAPIVAAGAAAFSTASSYEQATARIQSALGLTADEAERLGDVGEAIYEDGFGESLDLVDDALVTVRQSIGDLNDADLSYITKSVLTLSDTLDMDVGESVRGVNALMDGFGLSATDAMDLFVAGAQDGLNYSDELGDNLAEYGPRFAQMGFSASQYFSILKAGTENGAYNLDKVNDFLNEFQTSLSDGRMDESIGRFSQSTQDLFQSWKDGGATGQQVFEAVLGELAKMPDGYEKANLASTLWSSLGEDNALGMLTSLAGVEDKYGDVAGAAQAAGDAASDSFANKAQSAMRELQGAIEPLGTPLLNIATNVAGVVKSFGEWFDGIGEGGQMAVLAIAGILAAIGPVLSVAGNLVSVVPAVTAAITAAGGATGLLSGAMAALTGPVGIVIGAVAGLAAALVYCWNTSETFRAGVTSAWQLVCGAVSQAFAIIQPLLASLADFLVGGVLPAVLEMATGFGNAFASILAAAAAFASGVLQVIQGGLDLLLGTVQAVLGVIVGLFTGNWDMAREGVERALNGMLGIVNGLMNAIVAVVTGAGNAVVSLFTGAWNGAMDIVQSVLGKAVSFIGDKMGLAKRTVGGALDAIAGFFRGLKIQWPHIPLPHFTIKGKFSIVPPSMPKIGVSWYAKGGVFNGPSVIGVGEDGPEGVVPFNKRGAAPLAEGIAEQLEKLGGGNGGDTHVTINVYATVREEADIRKLSREIAKEIRRTQLREGAYA